MRKEIYQMLEIVAKTANPNMQIVNVRKNPNDETETICEATDTKRIIQIITKSDDIKEGQYKIAKTGKEYAMLPIPAEKHQRFPQTDRVLVRDDVATFKRSLKNIVYCYDVVMAEVLAYFGSLQEILTPGKQEHGINVVRPILLDVLKPWSGIDIAKTITMKATTPSYPIQLESETDNLKIKFVVMPFTR